MTQSTTRDTRLVTDAAAVEARDDAVVVALADRSERVVPYAQIDGVLLGATSVTLALADGSTVEIASGDAALGTLTRTIAAHLFALPEFTRSLRAFGAARSGGGAHDRYFAPLVTPLRALRYAHDDAVAAQPHLAWRAALTVDAVAVAAELRATIASLAAAHCPSSAPHCRALEAELLDDAEPLAEALDGVTAAAQRLTVALDQERARAWRAWCAALGVAVAAADRAWETSAQALADVPTVEPSRWRRLWRRGGQSG